MVLAPGDFLNTGLLNFALPLAILWLLSRDPYFHPRKSWILLVSGAFSAEALASVALNRGAQAALAAAGLAVVAPFAFWGVAAGLFFFWLWFNVRVFF